MAVTAGGSPAPSAARTLPDLELAITAVVAGGDGLAREASGRVVFVRGALPGERVAVVLTEERKDFARAEVVRVLEPSPDRVEPPCPYVAQGCGGCGWQYASPEAQARMKRGIVVESLRRIARIEDPPVNECVALPPTRYRTTVRVSVDVHGRPAFRKHARNDRVAVDDCLVAHPALAALLAEHTDWPKAGDVVLRVGARTGDVAVGDQPAVVYEEIAGRRYRISAGSFFQVRPDGAEELVRLVGDALVARNATSVVDLYAGVGLFAGAIHDRGIIVSAAVEGSRIAAADALVNLDGVCEVVEADVDKWMGTEADADAVVADPSRRGLMTGGVATIERGAPRVVVLVSCDAAALGRDTKLLVARGFRLEEATPVDLFPHTPHIEVVSTFVRL